MVDIFYILCLHIGNHIYVLVRPIYIYIYIYDIYNNIVKCDVGLFVYLFDICHVMFNILMSQFCLLKWT